MTAATNRVIPMPEPSDKQSAGPAEVGHRSPHRASADEPAAPQETPVPDGPSTEVFAVFGVEPEIQAYAMAKYSRSALSMKDALTGEGVSVNASAVPMT